MAVRGLRAGGLSRKTPWELTGGGTVTEVEHQDGDGAGLFEVEVTREDGSQVEIHLDENFNEVGSAPDDDKAEGSDDD